MGKPMNHHRGVKDAKARRAVALARIELNLPTVSRTAPASPTAMPIKVRPREEQELIDAFLAGRARR